MKYIAFCTKKKKKKKKEIVQHISKNTLSTLVDYIYGICSLGGSSTCVLDI